MTISDLLAKPAEFYVTIVAASIYVWESNKERPLASRFSMTISSALMGFSAGPSVAEYVGGSELLVTLLVTAIGFLMLELLTALIKDRKAVTEIIIKRLGGGK